MDLPTNPSALVDLLRAWFFAKDRSIVMANDAFIEGDEISTPGNPVSGRRRLYAKDDGWYELDSGGTELSLYNGLTYAIVADQKSPGSASGTFTSGAWRTRDLNTFVLNTIVGCTLTSNQITLPAGSYIFLARCPAYRVNSHKARLQNITDGVTAAVGSSTYASAGHAVQNDSIVLSTVEIAAPKVFELQHRCETTKTTNGFGTGYGGGFGIEESYATVLAVRYG